MDESKEALGASSGVRSLSAPYFTLKMTKSRDQAVDCILLKSTYKALD